MIARHVAERADEIAVVAHQPRQRRSSGARTPPPESEEQEFVLRHLRWSAVGPGPGANPAEAGRARSGRRPRPKGYERRSRSPSRPPPRRVRRSGLGRDLLQPDGGRESGRTAARDHDIELHRFSFRQTPWFCPSPACVLAHRRRHACEFLWGTAAGVTSSRRVYGSFSFDRPSPAALDQCIDRPVAGQPSSSHTRLSGRAPGCWPTPRAGLRRPGAGDRRR